jgi:hypothetical protein
MKLNKFFRLVIVMCSLFLSTGATWYVTIQSAVKPDSAGAIPIGDSTSAKVSTSVISESLKKPVATFAPFLDIIPTSDGTELLININPSNQLGGVIHANIYDAINTGPSGLKGSYTMPFSETTQAYSTQTSGLALSPNTNEDGQIGITTTLGLDTGTTNFQRNFVPASSPQTINSADGKFELKLINTNTISFDTYILVVPSFAPPGQPPRGQSLLGSPYSVRASGGLVATDTPMGLSLFYNELLPDNVDPHTLAISAWDAFNGQWDDLGGTLFTFPSKYISVATSRFSTYGLFATTTWRDKFDEETGLTSQDNIIIVGGGLPGQRRLELENTPGSGRAVSQPITPTTTIDSWGSLIFSATVNPPTTTLTVDVLSFDGTEVLTNVTSGTDLGNLVDKTQYPSLKLRVNMASSVATETPTLNHWQLSWQAEKYKIYMPLILK